MSGLETYLDTNQSKNWVLDRRVKGLPFSRSFKKTHSRKQDVDKILNTSPLWGRMIRALNVSPEPTKRQSLVRKLIIYPYKSIIPSTSKHQET